MIKIVITYIFILMSSVQIFAAEWNWKLYDTMPIPVAGAEIVTWDEKIYILGGYKEANSAPVSTNQHPVRITDCQNRRCSRKRGLNLAIT